TCDYETAPRCEPACHCEASFIAIGSRSRCTIAEVVEVSDEEMEQAIDSLAWQFVKAWGAPSYEIALRAARDEIEHTAGVCETLAPELWITVKRTRREGDGALEEQYAVYDRLMIGAHA